MTTATDAFMSQNNAGQGGDINFSASTGGMDLNLGGSGPLLQSSLPMGGGMAFDAGASSAVAGTTTTTTTTQHFTTTSTTGEVGLPPTGTLMGVGGGVGDNAQDVTYSTKSNTGFAFGTGGAGQTTTTTTTTTTPLHNMELVLEEQEKEVYYLE